MAKESQNVDKRCTFSSLISSYNNLYAMNAKKKTTLKCAPANCIRSCGFPIISAFY